LTVEFISDKYYTAAVCREKQETFFRKEKVDNNLTLKTVSIDVGIYVCSKELTRNHTQTKD
jgi:hypothetical protein